MKTTLLVVLILVLTPFQVHGKNTKKKIFNIDKKILAEIIIKQENPKRNPKLIGDKGFVNKAYGYFQIRQVYLTDVNKHVGSKRMMRTWKKKKLVMHDMLNPRKAEWVFFEYLSIYGEKYRRVKGGKLPTVRELARIHNGGPEGYQKWSTYKYGKTAVKDFAEFELRQKRKISSQKT